MHSQTLFNIKEVTFGDGNGRLGGRLLTIQV